jgi:hypothetical protein
MITNEIMDAAIKNEVESEIRPRKTATEDILIDKEIMFALINAALSVSEEDEFGTERKLN